MGLRTIRSVLLAMGLFVAIMVGAVSMASADPTFGVMNASGGIYWRSAPDWNTAEATAGNGFYPDTVIAVKCYQSGAGNVPGSANTMWELASVASGSGTGSGWINEHFINDGAPINAPSPGVPPCPATQSGGGVTPGGGVGTQSLPGGSLFFLPKDNNLQTAASKTITYPGWRGPNCKLNGGLPTIDGKRVTTLAGWSNGRLGPIYYLNAANRDQRAQIKYVLLIDPGGTPQFTAQGSCDGSARPSQVLNQWLALEPKSSRLVIIAARSTNNDKRVGLGKYYLKSLTKSQRSKQVLVCNEGNLPHRTAFDQFAAPSGAQTAFLKSRKFRCPYGVPTV